MEIKFGLENFLSWIKEVTEEFNFETDITIKTPREWINKNN